MKEAMDFYERRTNEYNSKTEAEDQVPFDGGCVMARGITERSRSNKYAQARLQAAAYNERLQCRPGAAAEIGISQESLKNYELGLCKVVPNDVVVRMADVYNAPELLNSYCTEDCPIGRLTQHELKLGPAEKALYQLILYAGTDMESAIRSIGHIVEDGRIDEYEKPELDRQLRFLDQVEKNISELKLIIKKTNRGC